MIIVHYSEIGVKGKNRRMFEEQLQKNLKKFGRVERKFGRLVLHERHIEGLEKIPGIAWFAKAERSDLKIEEIKKVVLKVLKEKNFESFKINARRSNKLFEFDSIKINKIIGEEVRVELKKRVELKNPDIVVWIEIGEKDAWIFTEKKLGVGGLPVGVSGRVVCSLSGGIDSPVAAFEMMKRGCEVVLVHFYGDVRDKLGVGEKIKKLNERLQEIGKTKLIEIPFGDIQREIIKEVKGEYRMLVYRRFMMRILDRVLEKVDGKAIVSGDNVGQVASQTLENLKVIWSASRNIILSPLIGMNKTEIIDIAKKIGTYEVSILPYEDCCSFMISKHPKLKARSEEIEKVEKNLNVDEMVEKTLKKII